MQSRNKKADSEVGVGDSMINDPAKVAEHFISNFCSVGAKSDSKILHSNSSLLTFMGQSCITSFHACPASNKEFRLIIIKITSRYRFLRSTSSWNDLC